MLKFILSFPALFLALTVTSSAYAFTPEAGQVIRFQPQLWRSSKAYAVKGSATYGKHKMETSLEWNGPGSLRMIVRDVPASFYADGSGSSSWVLIRSDRRCVLKSDNRTVSCPALSHWGALEFSASPDETAAALVEGGLIHPDSASYIETDSRQPIKDPAERNVFAALGANGRTPMAVLEIHGPNYRSEPEAEQAPLLRYDPTFLSPLLMRFSSDGELITISALSDLSMVNRKNRYAPILSSRLEISSGAVLRTTFLRQEPSPRTATPFQAPRAAADMQAFSDELSVEGQDFLKHLLLTH